MNTVWVVSLLFDANERWKRISQRTGCVLHHTDTLGLSLAELDRIQFGVIVVETRANSEDDLDLCRRLRLRFENPILLIAVGSDEEYCVRAYEAGVDECMAIAITDELVSAKLNAWLRWSVPPIATSTAQPVPSQEFTAQANAQ